MRTKILLFIVFFSSQIINAQSAVDTTGTQGKCLYILHSETSENGNKTKKIKINYEPLILKEGEYIKVFPKEGENGVHLSVGGLFGSSGYVSLKKNSIRLMSLVRFSTGPPGMAGTYGISFNNGSFFEIEYEYGIEEIKAMKEVTMEEARARLNKK